MKNILLFAIVILLTLIFRVGWIQFVNGEELQTLAYEQQTLDRKINPKRGTIYDSTGKYVLAVSSSVESVTVNPTNIPQENKEKVAQKLSEIFELDYEKVYKKVNKNEKKLIFSFKIYKSNISIFPKSSLKLSTGFI